MFTLDKLIITFDGLFCLLQGPSGEAGGPTYGSLYEPVHMGSRGGPDSVGAVGPRGGGISRIKVGGILLLDGTLDATGLSGSNGAGGGSGGSIWVTTGERNWIILTSTLEYAWQEKWMKTFTYFP